MNGLQAPRASWERPQGAGQGRIAFPHDDGVRARAGNSPENRSGRLQPLEIARCVCGVFGRHRRGHARFSKGIPEDTARQGATGRTLRRTGHDGHHRCGRCVFPSRAPARSMLTCRSNTMSGSASGDAIQGKAAVATEREARSRRAVPTRSPMEGAFASCAPGLSPRRVGCQIFAVASAAIDGSGTPC